MQAIFSLKPDFAELVLSGEKTVELRNRAVRLAPGTKIWIYATRPKAGVVGVTRVAEVVIDCPESIWERFHEEICVARQLYDEYTRGKELASAVVLGSVDRVRGAMTLDFLRERVRGFHPPQFYAHIARGSRLSEVLAQSVVPA